MKLKIKNIELEINYYYLEQYIVIDFQVLLNEMWSNEIDLPYKISEYIENSYFLKTLMKYIHFDCLYMFLIKENSKDII